MSVIGPDFETPMAALFAVLTAAATLSFTGDATEGNATLANVTGLASLFTGLPVFGPGVDDGATIQALNPGAGTLTLSSPLTAAGVAASFTTGFQTTSRRLQHWSQVEAQPALFLRRLGSDDHFSGEMPMTTIDCEVWIYSQAGEDPDVAPDVALSNLDRLVRQSFAPDEESRFTLGGLVYWCRVEGRSLYAPGDQASQGISHIPVRITLYPY